MEILTCLLYTSSQAGIDECQHRGERRQQDAEGNGLAGLGEGIAWLNSD